MSDVGTEMMKAGAAITVIVICLFLLIMIAGCMFVLVGSMHGVVLLPLLL